MDRQQTLCLKAPRTALKHKNSIDDEFWERCLEVARLHIEQAKIDSQIVEFDIPGEEWRQSEEYKLKYDSWTQWEKLMSKHRSKLHMTTAHDSFIRLFATTRFGLDIDVQGKRPSPLQRNMTKAMWEAYCPNAPIRRDRWDPIFRRWGTTHGVRAAHLFPWAQGPFMDDIFGEGARDELFSAENGLYLHSNVKRALENGKLVIVPDVDLGPTQPLDDLEARRARTKLWNKMKVKEFQVIVINMDDPEITETLPTSDLVSGITCLRDLHDRKLEFITDYRPRSRYIWWTFLNAILRISWRRNSKADNAQHDMQTAMRYWGVHGRYMERSQLLGFVEEIGHDFENILHGMTGAEDGKHNETPRYEAIRALVETTGVKTVRMVNEFLAEEDPEGDEEDDWGDDSDSYDEECY